MSRENATKLIVDAVKWKLASRHDLVLDFLEAIGKETSEITQAEKEFEERIEYAIRSEMESMGKNTETARRMMAGFDGTMENLKALSIRPKPLQIEAGKWYEDRMGKVVGPAFSRPNCTYPWDVGGETYLDNGLEFHGMVSDQDLIREVPAPHTVDA